MELAGQIDMALTVGQLLRNAREHAGFSVEDVADQLRLTKDIVNKIEDDGYTENQLTIFIRGYIRSYAKYVNVPSQEIESYFLSLGLVDQPQRVKYAKFELDKACMKKRPTKLLATYGVIALFAFLVLMWLFWQHHDASLSSTSFPPAAKVSTSKKVAQNTLQPKSLSDQFAKHQTLGSVNNKTV